MENKKKFTPNPDFKLLEQVRETLRYYHYARSTEKTYCQWITRYIYFFKKKVHPKDMGEKEIERFLSHLATHENRPLLPRGRLSMPWYFFTAMSY
jgi:hypothetical protein